MTARCLPAWQFIPEADATTWMRTEPAIAAAKFATVKGEIKCGAARRAALQI